MQRIFGWANSARNAKKKKDFFNFTPVTETRLRGLGSMQTGYLALAVTFLPRRITEERMSEGPHEAPAAKEAMALHAHGLAGTEF